MPVRLGLDVEHGEHTLPGARRVVVCGLQDHLAAGVAAHRREPSSAASSAASPVVAADHPWPRARRDVPIGSRPRRDRRHRASIACASGRGRSTSARLRTRSRSSSRAADHIGARASSLSTSGLARAGANDRPRARSAGDQANVARRAPRASASVDAGGGLGFAEHRRDVQLPPRPFQLRDHTQDNPRGDARSRRGRSASPGIQRYQLGDKCRRCRRRPSAASSMKIAQSGR